VSHHAIGTRIAFVAMAIDKSRGRRCEGCGTEHFDDERSFAAKAKQIE